jgi:hypothetical protein
LLGDEALVGRWGEPAKPSKVGSLGADADSDRVVVGDERHVVVRESKACRSPVARTPRPKPARTPVRSTHAGKPTSGSEIVAPTTPATLPSRPPTTSSFEVERIS